MSRYVRPLERPVKIFLYRELMDYYKISRAELQLVLMGVKLNTFEGAVKSIRKLDIYTKDVDAKAQNGEKKSN